MDFDSLLAKAQNIANIKPEQSDATKKVAVPTIPRNSVVAPKQEKTEQHKHGATEDFEVLLRAAIQGTPESKGKPEGKHTNTRTPAVKRKSGETKRTEGKRQRKESHVLVSSEAGNARTFSLLREMLTKKGREPIFIVGGPGVGKRTMVQHVCRKMDRPTKNLLDDYMDADTFVDELQNVMGSPRFKRGTCMCFFWFDGQVQVLEERKPGTVDKLARIINAVRTYQLIFCCNSIEDKLLFPFVLAVKGRILNLYPMRSGGIRQILRYHASHLPGTAFVPIDDIVAGCDGDIRNGKLQVEMAMKGSREGNKHSYEYVRDILNPGFRCSHAQSGHNHKEHMCSACAGKYMRNPKMPDLLLVNSHTYMKPVRVDRGLGITKKQHVKQAEQLRMCDAMAKQFSDFGTQFVFDAVDRRLSERCAKEVLAKSLGTIQRLQDKDRHHLKRGRAEITNTKYRKGPEGWYRSGETKKKKFHVPEDTEYKDHPLTNGTRVWDFSLEERMDVARRSNYEAVCRDNGVEPETREAIVRSARRLQSTDRYFERFIRSKGNLEPEM